MLVAGTARFAADLCAVSRTVRSSRIGCTVAMVADTALVTRVLGWLRSPPCELKERGTAAIHRIVTVTVMPDGLQICP